MGQSHALIEIKKAWADVKDDYNRDFMLRETALSSPLLPHPTSVRQRLLGC